MAISVQVSDRELCELAILIGKVYSQSIRDEDQLREELVYANVDAWIEWDGTRLYLREVSFMDGSCDPVHILPDIFWESGTSWKGWPVRALNRVLWRSLSTGATTVATRVDDDLWEVLHELPEGAGRPSWHVVHIIDSFSEGTFVRGRLEWVGTVKDRILGAVSTAYAKRLVNEALYPTPRSQFSATRLANAVQGLLGSDAPLGPELTVLRRECSQILEEALLGGNFAQLKAFWDEYFPGESLRPEDSPWRLDRGNEDAPVQGMFVPELNEDSAE